MTVDPRPSVTAPAAGSGGRTRRVLVTGAAGFIGSHLAEALLDAGHDVVGVDAFVDSYPRWLKERNLLALRRHERFTFAEQDLLTDGLDELLEGVEVVINEAAFAGLPRSWTETDAYVRNNVTGLARLVTAARAHGVQRFVQASTSSVYGLEAVGDEQRPTRPASPYGVSKLAAEHLLLAHVQADGFPAVILRYFSIYGPRQRPDMAYHIIIEAVRSGKQITIYGDGHQSRSNTFISDCVAGSLAAIDKGEVGEVYNIGGGELLALNRAVSIISQVLGREPRLHHEPARAGDQRVTHADTGKARRDLGYVPTVAPEEGLRRQIGWHLDTFEGDRAARWSTAAVGPNGSPHPTRIADLSPLVTTQEVR